MSRNVRTMVLTGNGINCERETAFACRLAGADDVEMVSLWDWAAGKVSLSRFNLICFPGGFLDGDDLGGARACATRIKHTRSPSSGKLLVEELAGFVNEGKLIMGICNGFQLLVKLGLLPSAGGTASGGGPESAWRQTATLTFNTIGRFENRWVTLKADPGSPCVFTRGIDTLALPVRHGEGRLVIDESIVDAISSGHQVPLHYVDPVNLEPTESYPFNPNGSRFGAAALCDASGRILGMMPHPECYWNPLNHTDWSRSKVMGPDHGEGLIFFKNAVQYLKEMQ